ncbi:type II toxin-antitoxin system VapC family toxin [Tateyamaria sp.]|uniref:type II toxin-antitoxin system VapC family toxin n=1 Tax=Tateyamaria sp. TaxID=1929288 RepID=UPI003B21981D
MIILDTMVLSEPMKPQPDPNVIAWLDQQVPSDLYTTVINQAEMYYGLYSLPDGRKKDRLKSVLIELFKVDFKDRILGFEGDAPFQFGVQIALARQKHGRDYVKDLDGLIAAVALDNNDCTVATRDLRPFEAMGVDVVNPWQT